MAGDRRPTRRREPAGWRPHVADRLVVDDGRLVVPDQGPAETVPVRADAGEHDEAGRVEESEPVEPTAMTIYSFRHTSDKPNGSAADADAQPERHRHERHEFSRKRRHSPQLHGLVSSPSHVRRSLFFAPAIGNLQDSDCRAGAP